jgi:hypothetical protein
MNAQQLQTDFLFADAAATAAEQEARDFARQASDLRAKANAIKSELETAQAALASSVRTP